MKKIWKYLVNLFLTILVVIWVGLLLIIGTFVDNPWKKIK